MSLVSESDGRAHSELSCASAEFVREAIRRSEYSGHTAGLCSGLLQCNLVILPEEFSQDFKSYCDKNPVPCPLMGMSRTGEPYIEGLGPEIDLRTDLPRYRVYENGAFSKEYLYISDQWRDDFVAFALGCSFTFEKALTASGIEMRHIVTNVTVPMFKTNIATVPCGVFHGPTVVSMRPIKRSDIKRVKEICSAYPHAHGSPIHVGDPAKIGIETLTAPDWGDPVFIRDDEVPAFWGCGVTSQVAISNARPDLCITHAPGAMLITNVNEFANSDWRIAGPPDEKPN